MAIWVHCSITLQQQSAAGAVHVTEGGVGVALGSHVTMAHSHPMASSSAQDLPGQATVVIWLPQQVQLKFDVPKMEHFALQITMTVKA